MAKFTYYLRDINAQKETPIHLIVNWNNQRLKFPTKQYVHPKYWDSKNNIIYDKKCTNEVREVRRKLINDIAHAKELFVKFENENKRTPTRNEFREVLEINLYGEVKKDVDLDLVKYVLKFIEESKLRNNEKTGKPISVNTLRAYMQLYNSLVDYSKSLRKSISFDDIDLDFYFDFKSYLIKQNYSTNSIGKRISQLKTILRDATERGLNKNLAYQSKRFKVTREQVENIYLNESELMEIYQLDLSNDKRLSNVRDLFLIGSWTALRWSDISKLRKSDIKDGFIEIETQKTREKVVIPVHPVVSLILDKYDLELPRALSNQKMNEYLKEIGAKLESLNIASFRKITRGGKEISIKVMKYERLTTHTARRSFASNLFLDGIPSQTIMKITGHKSEKSFMTYIKITPQENANIIKMHWEKKSKLQVI